MADILITWELGGGLGHLVPLRALAGRLIQNGHNVSLAARDLIAAGRVFRGLPICFYQAPHKIEPFKPDFDPPISYHHMLHNIGFGDEDGLRALISAWRSIFQCCDPEVALFDHSPTAIFASRGMRFRKAMLGTGFTVPPTPLPIIRPWINTEGLDLTLSHAQTTKIANSVSASLGMPAVHIMDEIYTEATPFLCTYAELDHFGKRSSVDYIGISVDSVGAMPAWPYGDGPKIFAYLKMGEMFHAIVSQLYRLRLPCIVFCSSLQDQDVRRLENEFPSISFCKEEVNLELVVRDCNVAVCHGGHGFVARMLLAGIPVVALPLHLEQTLLSLRLASIGAGVYLSTDHISQLGVAINHVASENSFQTAAMAISAIYSSSQSKDSWEKVISWVELRNTDQ